VRGRKYTGSLPHAIAEHKTMEVGCLMGLHSTDCELRDGQLF
jgi:hypothetical protein